MTTPATPSNPQPTPAPTPAPGGKPTVTFEEFAKLDLRVAKIVKVEPHPNADKLYKLQLDDGSGTPRQICAGIREHYEPDQLLGQRIVIVANLAPRVIRGEESRGMLLAASNVSKDAAAAGEQRSVVILTTLSDIGPGAVVS
ncbi:MAG TPA: hypothetical protein VD971_11735 [Phycisphaerales bacterium]|nr:hypothetical protein [Phycisphaerales bacterium]